jgi:hypothetical protein
VAPRHRHSLARRRAWEPVRRSGMGLVERLEEGVRASSLECSHLSWSLAPSTRVDLGQTRARRADAMIAGHFGLAVGVKSRERQVRPWAMIREMCWNVKHKAVNTTAFIGSCRSWKRACRKPMTATSSHRESSAGGFFSLASLVRVRSFTSVSGFSCPRAHRHASGIARVTRAI